VTQREPIKTLTFGEWIDFEARKIASLAFQVHARTPEHGEDFVYVQVSTALPHGLRAWAGRSKLQRSHSFRSEHAKRIVSNAMMEVYVVRIRADARDCWVSQELDPTYGP